MHCKLHTSVLEKAVARMRFFLSPSNTLYILMTYILDFLASRIFYPLPILCKFWWRC